MQAFTPALHNHFGEHNASATAIDDGLITWEQAALWFERYLGQITNTRAADSDTAIASSLAVYDAL